MATEPIEYHDEDDDRESCYHHRHDPPLGQRAKGKIRKDATEQHFEDNS
jgi:hypothetical protein